MPPLRQTIAGEESVFIAPLGGLECFPVLYLKLGETVPCGLSRNMACFSLVLSVWRSRI